MTTKTSRLLTSQDQPARTPPGSPGLKGWLSRLMRASVVMLKKQPRINWGQILGASVVLLSCFAMIGFGYKGLRDTQSESVTREANRLHIDALRGQYAADIRLFDTKTGLYLSCMSAAVTRVQVRDDIRGTLFDFADGISDTLASVFPGDASAVAFGIQFSSDRHEYVDEHYPALDLDAVQETCATPGPEPVKPAELVKADGA